MLIGGVDVRAMRLDDLLDRIAIVFQDTYLLNDSIENNLRLARPEASDADLVAAARQRAAMTSSWRCRTATGA